MSNNKEHNNKAHTKQTQRYQRQRGSALTVAIFVIVVMSVLGAALVRLLGGSSAAVIAEVSGNRALNAANAGVELFLPALFPLNSETNNSVCPDTSLTQQASYDFSAHSSNSQNTGLQNCQVSVACRALDLGEGAVHFRVVANGQCQVGGDTFSREIVVEATDVGV